MQPRPDETQEDRTGVPVTLDAPADPSNIAPLSATEVAAVTTPPPAIEDGRSRFRVGTLVYTTGGLVVLFFWLLFGDFAISLRDRSVGQLMQKMLNSFKVSNLTMAILLSMIPTAITLVISPVVSYKSDRLRSRWGRRIPYLLIPTPIAAVSMIGLGFCPQLAYVLEDATNHAISHTTGLLIVFGVLWTLFEIAVVVAGSVFNGLINDVVPRPVIGRFYGLFRAVSLIDGMIFFWFILGHAEVHFTLICIWIASVFGIGFTIMCFMVKEGEYPAEQKVHDHRAGGFMAAVRVYFRECFSKSHYLWIYGALTLTALAANPINTWALVYAEKFGLKLVPWDPVGVGFGEWRLGYGGVIAVTYVFSLLLAYPIGALVDRFHPLRVAMVTMLLYALSCLVAYVVIHDATSFLWALLVHGVLSGSYFTASAAITQVLLPRARFSQFASAGVVVTQVATLFYTPLLAQTLDWTNSNYQITFLLSGLFASMSMLLLVRVYRRFIEMGGPKGYVAPV